MHNIFRTPAIALCLADATGAEKIQLFRVGTFTHPEYGKFEITPQMLAEIKKNFDAKVRGVDLAIDYKHDNEDIAAGWIKNLELSDDGQALFATPDWTPKGKKVIQDKEFRYISPEFAFKYTDSETLKNHGPMLLGAALTNRPFIKKMEPVQLSEMDGAKCLEDTSLDQLVSELVSQGYSDSDASIIANYILDEEPLELGGPGSGPQGGGGGAKQAARRAANLSKSNASFVAFKQRGDAVKSGIQKAKANAIQSKSVAQSTAARHGKLSENLKGEKKMGDLEQGGDLSAMKPEDLIKMITELKGKLSALQSEKESAMAEKKMSEKKAAFAKMLSEGKVCAAQEAPYLAGDMDKFTELHAPVKLSENGNSNSNTDDKSKALEDVEDEIVRLAEEKLSNKKAKSIGEATNMVLSERKDLREKYENKFKN